MLKMLIELLGGKTEENHSQRTNEDSNRTFNSIEDILNVVEDPVKRIITAHKIGENVTEEVRGLVKEPEKYKAKRIIDKRDYVGMLEELESAGIIIPQESVDFWLHQNSGDLTYGLPKNMSKYASREAIHKKGMKVYKSLVKSHEKGQSDDFETYFKMGFGEESKRERIAISFGLTQKDTLELDKRAFSNMLAFSVGGDLYRMGYMTTESVEDVLKNSRITEFRKILGLEKEQVADIVEEYVRIVLAGKSPMKNSTYNRYRNDIRRESIENAYGLLLEFGDQLKLTEAEERKLAKMYIATEYVNIPLIEKYFPDEVAERRKSNVRANEAAKFKQYSEDMRARIKSSEPFESERFVQYDRNCFMEALKYGDFGLAHKIASERDYQECSLLERLTKE